MYAKVFQQIYDSSIADDWEVRVVFIDLLILADREGIVDMTHEAIAARTRMPLEMVNKAINVLTEPDQKSRTPDHEGRRLVPLDDRRGWGWRIVNFQHYHKIRDENDRKSYMRRYMREYRLKQSETPVNNVNHVNNSLASPMSVCTVYSSKEGECEGKPKEQFTHSPAEKASKFTKFTKPTLAQVELYSAKIGLDASVPAEFMDYYEANGWKVGKNPMRSWEATLRTWKHRREMERDQKKKPTSVYELKTIRDAKQKMADELRYKHCFEGPMGNQWGDDMAREECVKLKKEIKDLDRRIGGTA